MVAVAGCALAAAVQRGIIAMAIPGPSPVSWIVMGVLITIVVLVLGVRQPERIAAATMMVGTGLTWGLIALGASWLLHLTGWLSIIEVGYLLALHALSVGVLFGAFRWVAGDGRLASLLAGGFAGIGAGIVAVVIMALVQLALGAFLVGDSLGALFGLGVLFLLPAALLGVATSTWIRWRGNRSRSVDGN
jgi:hypothetical protein